MDDLDDCGIFRKSMNDITSMLDINFGSLDRPRRGGRGRGTPVVPGGRPERARPMLDMVRHQRGAASLSNHRWCNVPLFPPGGAFGSKPWQPGGIPSTADWKITRKTLFLGNVGCTWYLTQVNVSAILKVWVLLYLIFFFFLKHKRHHLTLENKYYCKFMSWLCFGK